MVLTHCWHEVTIALAPVPRASSIFFSQSPKKAGIHHFEISAAAAALAVLAVAGKFRQTDPGMERITSLERQTLEPLSEIAGVMVGHGQVQGLRAPALLHQIHQELGGMGDFNVMGIMFLPIW